MYTEKKIKKNKCNRLHFDHENFIFLIQITESQFLLNSIIKDLLPTIGNQQELWACGVTYLRSKVCRQEESKAAGGGDFHEKVYHAERPEVFFRQHHTGWSHISNK